MAKKMIRPVIDVIPHFEGNDTIFEAYGKVYAGIFREKLRAKKSAPLNAVSKKDKLKSL